MCSNQQSSLRTNFRKVSDSPQIRSRKLFFMHAFPAQCQPEHPSQTTYVGNIDKNCLPCQISSPVDDSPGRNTTGWYFFNPSLAILRPGLVYASPVENGVWEVCCHATLSWLISDSHPEENSCRFK